MTRQTLPALEPAASREGILRRLAGQNDDSASLEQLHQMMGYAPGPDIDGCPFSDLDRKASWDSMPGDAACHVNTAPIDSYTCTTPTLSRQPTRPAFRLASSSGRGSQSEAAVVNLISPSDTLLQNRAAACSCVLHTCTCSQPPASLSQQLPRTQLNSAPSSPGAQLAAPDSSSVPAPGGNGLQVTRCGSEPPVLLASALPKLASLDTTVGGDGMRSSTSTPFDADGCSAAEEAHNHEGMSDLLSSFEALGARAPTRQLWLGNLNTRVHKTALHAIFDRYGAVEDVVVFPGRMYAFVNYHRTEDAAAAARALHDTYQPSITASNKLIVRFRLAKVPEGNGSNGSGSAGTLPESGAGSLAKPAESMFAAEKAPCSRPSSPTMISAGWAGDVWDAQHKNALTTAPLSRRLWLGNIVATASPACLHAVFSRYGAVTDAAVFPARVGPLGYAFVSFETADIAWEAYSRLNGTVVPSLSGSKQLKMRFKPTKDESLAAAGDGSDKPASLAGGLGTETTRHLWLGNIPPCPDHAAIESMFSHFGALESVRTFPGCTHAHVNFYSELDASRAVSSLRGIVVPSVTGNRPLTVRCQSAAAASRTAGSQPATVLNPFRLPACGPFPPMTGHPSLATQAALSGSHWSTRSAEEAEAGPPDAGDGLGGVQLPAINLSNRLNPNNVYYDVQLAQRYKKMSKAEKEMMWAQDRWSALVQGSSAKSTSALPPFICGLPSLPSLQPDYAADSKTDLLEDMQFRAGLPASLPTGLFAGRRMASSAAQGLQTAPLLPASYVDASPASSADLFSSGPQLRSMGSWPGYAATDYEAPWGHQEAGPYDKAGRSGIAGMRPPLPLLTTSDAGSALNSRHSPLSSGSFNLLSPAHSSLPPLPSASPLHSCSSLPGAAGAELASSAPLVAAVAATLHARSLQEPQVPEPFLCPLTRRLMDDPVEASDGHVYERSAISAWLLRQATSPITGHLLYDPSLSPRERLREHILRWRAERSMLPPP